MPEELESEVRAPDLYGLQDRLWDEDRWRILLETLIANGFFTWKDVAILALGQSNPPQAGTSIATNKNFQEHHRTVGGPSVMQQVYAWLYEQTGRCADCGTRLDLQADHVDPRQDSVDDPAQVDRLDNLTLRCRRHNVIRRRSHKLGGKTHLTAEAALMWILLVIRPRTYKDFARLCRLYGMTMADVRFKEAWAMALWLEREGLYEIEDLVPADYQILRWPDGSLTRQRPTASQPPNATLVGVIANDKVAVFLTMREIGDTKRFVVHRIPIRDLPFSTYDLGVRPPTDIAVAERQPRADDEGNLIALPMLPPRGLQLVGEVLFVEQGDEVEAQWQHGAALRGVKANGYSKKVVANPPTPVTLAVSKPSDP
jgi:hypothetical protein